jgi:flagellar motor switch protein FliN/FliY
MPADARSLMRLQVPLIVQVGTCRLPLEEVLAWTPGSIVELPKRADEELELLVSNKVIGRGRAVKVGGNFGIRVTAVGDERQRLGAVEAAPEAATPETPDDQAEPPPEAAPAP